MTDNEGPISPPAIFESFQPKPPMFEEPKAAEPAKRKPGRPKKTEAPAKRKPGRPKKAEAAAPAKRKRKPKGDKHVVEAKRKPGRPRKVAAITPTNAEVAAKMSGYSLGTAMQVARVLEQADETPFTHIVAFMDQLPKDMRARITQALAKIYA